VYKNNKVKLLILKSLPQLQGLIQNFLGPEDEGRKLLQNTGDYL
jgi:hypothetical protein